MNTNNENQKIKFQSTDGVITTLVALSSEPTLRFELKFKDQLVIERLKSALKALMLFEPVLSSRLVLSDEPYYQRLNISDSEQLLVTDAKDEYEKFKNLKIDIEKGPLSAFALYRADDGDTLLFKVAHEAADGFGLREAVHFVAQCYREKGAAGSNDYTHHELSRSPKRLIRQFHWSQFPKLIWLNLKEKVGYFFPAGTMSYVSGESGLVNPAFITREISAETVIAMRAYARKHESTLNDMLLAAFLRAMAFKVDFQGDTALRILLTINLRRYLSASDIASSDICNLSAMECVNLKRELGHNFLDTLSKVSVVTKKKKKAGIGLSFILDLILNEKIKFTTQKKMGQSTREMVMKTENFAVTVTNVGDVDKTPLTFNEPPSDIEMFAPLAYAPFWCFAVYEFDGKLKLSCAIDDRRTILLQDLFNAVEEQIRTTLREFNPSTGEAA